MKYTEKYALSKGAGLILGVGLPTVAAVLLALPLYIRSLDGMEAARLLSRRADLCEHIAMSDALVTGGALLYDLAWKERH